MIANHSSIDIDYDRLGFEELRNGIHIFQPWSTGKGRNKKTGAFNFMRTAAGDIELSEWKNAVKSLIARSGEEELYRQLYEHLDLPEERGIYKDVRQLEQYADRIFDNPEWVGFIPFNQQYRPEVLTGVKLVKVKCVCCNIPGMITEARYEIDKDYKKCYCPICGRFSEMEVIAMQKINSFQILRVTMRGFKCFKDETKFEFGGMTFIKGANGLGKSSIADAVAFAFTGSTFFGEKGMDKLHHLEAPEIEVTVELFDETGEIHSLTRTHKNDASAVFYDGHTARQTDISAMFGDKDLFLSMFNPLYLIDTMGADGKELLEKLLPFINHEAVLEALPEPVKSQMKDEKILSPETYIKNKRTEIKDLEKDLLYLQGQSDLRDTEVKDAQTAIRRLTEEIKTVGGQIKSLETLRASNWTDCDESRLAELKRQWDELTADKEDPEEIRLRREIRAAESRIAELNGSTYQSSFTEQIADMNASLKSLYGEYGEITGLINSIKPGYKCPSCFMETTEANLNAVKNAMLEKQQICVSAGTKAKKDLVSVQKQDAAAKSVFEKSTAGQLSELNNKLQQLQGQHTALEADQAIQMKELRDSITSVYDEMKPLEFKKENGNLTPEQFEELNSLRQTKTEMETQLTMSSAILEKPGFAEQIAETEKRIAQLKAKVSNAITYLGVKNDLLFNGLNLNRVKILLHEEVKTTGELKETFRFTYNGRDFKRLSLSEKIRAGLEAAELVKRLSGRNYPTFIDNSESVCVIDNVRPTSQLIFALVEKGKPLSVTAKAAVRVAAQREAA